MKAKYIISSIALAVLLQACQSGDKQEQLAKLKEEYSALSKQIKTLEAEIAAADTTSKEDKGFKVGTETAQKSDFKHYLEVQGKIDSDKNIVITSSIGGEVKTVYAVKGQTVKKGDLLAKTDDAALLRNLEQLDKNLELATQVYEKQKALWDQKIGTEIQYLQAKTNKESLEKNRAALLEQIEKTKLRAPFAGVVDEIFTKQGEVLAPGMPAFRLFNSEAIKLVADVSESYVSKLKVGQDAIIVFPDLKEEITSKVMVVGDVINPVNRTINVELAIKQDKNKYKANMIAYIKIKDYSNKEAITVPINVVQKNGSEEYVYVADGNVAKKVIVTLGRVSGNRIEIISGLTDGMKVITVGYQDLVDGQAISL
ncbi:MAG: efflux RND transporter periplasmic adaptor subunit [Cytophagaceae bacterium]